MVPPVRMALRMAQKFTDWLDQIKKYQDQIKSLVGIGPLVLGVVTMWQGDHGPLVVSLTACGILLLGLAYIAFSKEDSKLERGQPYPKFRQWHKWARRGFVAVIVFTAAGTSDYVYLAVKAPKKLILLVADFNGPDPQKYGVTENVLHRLRQALRQYKDAEIRPLGRAITEVEGSESARSEGTKRKAAIVIWGWYRATSQAVQLSVNFEVLKRPKHLPDFGSLGNGAPQTISTAEMETFAMQINLSQEMAYLSLFTLATFRLSAGDFEGAVARCTDALGQVNTGDSIVDRGMVYALRGEAYMLAKDYTRSRADYDRALLLQPNNAEAYAGRGSLSSLTGNFDAAVADLDRAIQFKPEWAEIYVNRGGVYCVLGELDRSLKDLDQAIRLRPDLPLAYINRAAVYTAKESLDQALADYNRALSIDAHLAGAYQGRGHVYSLRGDLGRAMSDYNRAIQLDPTLWGAYAQRGEVYRRRGEGARAKQDFDRQVQLQPNRAESYLMRARNYVFWGDLKSALPDWNRAVDLEPNSPAPYLARGVGYQLTNDRQRALEDFNKAIDLDPTSPTAYASRAGLYVSTNDLDSALSDIQKALDIDPDMIELYYGRGDIYQKQGEKEKAIADFEAVVRAAPQSPLAAQAKSQLNNLGVTAAPR